MATQPICDEQHEVCQNGGVCVILSDPKFNFCKCVVGFAGAKCHGKVEDANKISACTENGGECQNGGECVLATEFIMGQSVPANYCQCKEGTNGNLCHGTGGNGGGGGGGKSQLEEAALAAAEELFDNDAAASAQQTTSSKPTLKPTDSPVKKTQICTPDGGECNNGSSCVEKDNENGIPENHCICIDGYFGQYCNGKHTPTKTPTSASTAKPTQKPTTQNTTLKPTHKPTTQNTTLKPTQKTTHWTIKTRTPTVKTDTDGNPICVPGGPKRCENGGVCVAGSNQIDGSPDNHCKCPEGASGDLCETVGVCELKCQHGGSCRNYDDVSHANHKSSFTCECSGNYKGVECEIPFKTCPLTSDNKAMECLYGGECVYVEGSNEYECECPKGRSGKYCENGVDSTIEDYNGDCYEDEDCQHGGLCIRSHNAETTAKTNMVTKDTQCLCARGWGGPNCERECDLLCHHGSSCRFRDEDSTHANDSSGAYCDCVEDEFKGLECEIAVEKCPGIDGMECLFGGKCIGSEDDAQGDFYNCACPEGRTGTNCEKREEVDFQEPVRVWDDKNTPSSSNNASKLSNLTKGVDPGLLTIGLSVLAFLLFVPGVLLMLRRNKRRKAAAAAQESTIAESLDGDFSAPTEETGGGDGGDGVDNLAKAANGAANGDDIFDYDTDGVVNVNLDENEAVPLPADKQIV